MIARVAPFTVIAGRKSPNRKCEPDPPVFGRLRLLMEKRPVCAAVVEQLIEDCLSDDEPGA